MVSYEVYCILHLNISSKLIVSAVISITPTFQSSPSQNSGLIVGTTVGVVVLVLLFITFASKLCIIIKGNAIIFQYYFSFNIHTLFEENPSKL